MARGPMTDEEWAFFAPFLIENRSRGGRPPADHRRVLDAVFWIARTGSPWRDLPSEFGNWNPGFRQYRRWTKAAVWDAICDDLEDRGAEPVIPTTSNRKVQRPIDRTAYAPCNRVERFFSKPEHSRRVAT